MKFVWFTLFFVMAVLCVAYAQQTRNVQPEPVTDPVVLRRLNCQMHCRNELEDQSPDCIYNCISPKCFRRVFKKIIDKDTGRITQAIPENLQDKFSRCSEKEMIANDEL